MCEYFSCIIDRKLKVHWLKYSVSHDTIIRECKLQDEKLENRDIVRIEITPNDYKKITRNKKDWKFKVDEGGTLPDWFKKKMGKCKELCWKAWKMSVKINIAIKSEIVVIKDNRFVEAYDSATVEAYDSATVKACDSATVEAYDSATVKAYDSATVKACDSATVKAYGSATVKAYDSATVKAYDSATVKACDSANIIQFSGKVTLKGKAKKIDRRKE